MPDLALVEMLDLFALVEALKEIDDANVVDREVRALVDAHRRRRLAEDLREPMYSFGTTSTGHRHIS